MAPNHPTLKQEVKHKVTPPHRPKSLLKYLAAKVLLLEAVGSISKLAVCRFLPCLLSKAAAASSGRQANSCFQQQAISIYSKEIYLERPFQALARISNMKLLQGTRFSAEPVPWGSESKLGEVTVSVPQICKMGPAVTAASQREQMPDASAEARAGVSQELWLLDSEFSKEPWTYGNMCKLLRTCGVTSGSHTGAWDPGAGVEPGRAVSPPQGATRLLCFWKFVIITASLIVVGNRKKPKQASKLGHD